MFRGLWCFFGMITLILLEGVNTEYSSKAKCLLVSRSVCPRVYFLRTYCTHNGTWKLEDSQAQVRPTNV